MDIIVLIGRILFGILFLASGMGHLTQLDGMARYAASKGVPAPRTAILVTGIVIIVGALSVVLGFFGRIGALLLFLFLLGTAFMIHNFWAVKDPQEKQNEMAHFLKDLALAGASLVIVHFGTGAYSITDW